MPVPAIRFSAALDRRGHLGGGKSPAAGASDLGLLPVLSSLALWSRLLDRRPVVLALPGV